MKVRIEWKAQDAASLDLALSDLRLSFRAKGVLAFFLSSASGATFDLRQLTIASSEGKDARRTALAELEIAGYCKRIETADEGDRTDRDEPAEEEGPVPVMDSLFGESFAPPIRIDELPDAVEREGLRAEDPQGAAVERIVHRLNELREKSWEWAHYTPLRARYPKNVEQIKRRLQDGNTEQELILVLEYRASIDGGDEKSRRYFNCDTPFNTRNFEENLALALDWEARGRAVGVVKKPGTNRGKDYYLGKKRSGR